MRELDVVQSSIVRVIEHNIADPLDIDICHIYELKIRNKFFLLSPTKKLCVGTFRLKYYNLLQQ